MRFAKRHPEFVFLAIIIVLAGIAGTSDFETELLEARAYCTNVTEGLWPDYNGNVQEVCDEVRRIDASR